MYTFCISQSYLPILPHKAGWEGGEECFSAWLLSIWPKVKGLEVLGHHQLKEKHNIDPTDKAPASCLQAPSIDLS